MEAGDYLRKYAVGNSFPKPILLCVFKDMENYELIKLVDRRSLRIINENRNKIIDNPSKMFHTMKLW